MKNILFLLVFGFSFSLFAQNDAALIKHYEAFYKQMKVQGDTQGIINALTHLTILKPSEARKDTLAYVYLNEGKYTQALNIIGIEQKATDSNIAIEVKAIALKSIGELERALPFYEAIYTKLPGAQVAYEIADIYMNLNKFSDSKKYIDLGLASVTDTQGKAFYEMQQPYQVPLKAAFYYLEAIAKFNENKVTNKAAAIVILDKALAIEPNFNMALIVKNALSQPIQNTETKN